MITKCVKFSTPDNSEQAFIVKSGHKDLYLVMYESFSDDTEYEYHNKRYLLTLFPEHESEINEL